MEYKYQQFNGDEYPAPCMDISIINPETQKSFEVKAILDTGSDITVIPQSILDELEIYPVGLPKEVSGITGFDKVLYASVVDIGFCNTTENLVVYGNDTAVDQHIILGRNFLHSYPILFNAPDRTFQLIRT